MSQTNEAATFIQRIMALPPGVSLDSVLGLSIDDEAEIRRLFASGARHRRLIEMLVGLVDVYAAPSAIRTIRARIVTCRADRFSRHILPLPESERRKDGTCSMVPSILDFQRNWGVSTEDLLEKLDFKNIIAAGGAVLNSILPLPETLDTTSKHALRKHFRDVYPSSDIDLFVYGLNEDQAKAKIIHVYKTIQDAIPYKVAFKLTKHTVSFIPPAPYRTVQVILHRYRSPAEILVGFDLDSSCFLYNGVRVYASPRGIIATMRQSNTVDISRHSPDYELRLAKHASRGFEIYIPTLDRDRLDAYPCKTLSADTGLASLATIEWHMDQYQSLHEMRRKFDIYLDERCKKTGGQANRANYSQLANNISNVALDDDNTLLGIPISFCDDELDRTYVNPPTSMDDWCAEAYLGTFCTFFEAIKAQDRDEVNRFLEMEDFDPNQRDAFGNTALRLAVLTGNDDIASDILDAGAAPDIGMEYFVNKLVEAVLTQEEKDSNVSEEYLSGSECDSDARSIRDTENGQPQEHDEPPRNTLPNATLACECFICKRERSREDGTARCNTREDSH